MDLDDWLKSLEATGVATLIRENESLFPWIESVHVLAIVTVVGTISIVDLRLLGLASVDRAVGRLTRELLPCTWIAFAIAAFTGALLFSSKATESARMAGGISLVLWISVVAFGRWIGFTLH